MNTISKKFAFIFLAMAFVSSFAFAGNQQRNHKQSHAVFTIFKMTPRQFSKGYQAERKDYKLAKDNSTRQMNRRLKGPWFKRWFNKTF